MTEVASMHAVPSIHAVRKTLKHPSLVDAAIMRAAQACCGSPILQPVYLPGAGRVAYVRGRNWRDPRVDVWPLPEKHWAGFSTYDDLISELTAGKKYTANFSKAATTIQSLAARNAELESGLVETTEWLDDATSPYVWGSGSHIGWEAEQKRRVTAARSLLNKDRQP
jgi:hypothetical protein